MDISVQFSNREDSSSLSVPYAKLQEAKSDYLGQLIVTPEMAAKKTKAMKDIKSRGISPKRLLMETVEQINIPLARVSTLFSRDEVFPVEWKEAHIIPLFEKVSKNKSDN